MEIDNKNCATKYPSPIARSNNNNRTCPGFLTFVNNSKRTQLNAQKHNIKLTACTVKLTKKYCMFFTCYEVTFVKTKSTIHSIFIKIVSSKAYKDSKYIDSSTVNHSVIRGLVTKRLMVRRQLYNLTTWINDFLYK